MGEFAGQFFRIRSFSLGEDLQVKDFLPFDQEPQDEKLPHLPGWPWSILSLVGCGWLTSIDANFQFPAACVGLGEV